MSYESFQNDKYFDRYRIEAARKISIAISSEQIHTSKPIRCYFLSDLHADTERNQKWVRENCQRKDDDKDFFTVFIIPGDIGTEVDRILSVLKVSIDCYNAVCYIPGNHEAWRRGILAGGSALNPGKRASNREATDSVLKLAEILDNAKALGVHVGPLKITSTFSDKSMREETFSISAAISTPFGQCSIQDDKNSKNNGSSVIILPLYSWYHGTWDTEPELTQPDYLEAESCMPFSKKWGDFSFCKWPDDLISHSEFTNLQSSTSLAESFAALNEPYLHPPPYKMIPPIPRPSLSGSENSARDGGTDTDMNFDKTYIGTPLRDSPSDTVLSFSHFLPRIELCPEKRFLLEPGLTKVVGSDPLESQVRRLQPDLHMFGHTHIPIDLELEGIRYVQWPLGYHRESDKQCMPIYSTGPLLVFDSFLGTGKQGIPPDMASVDCYWSHHYRKNPTRDTSPDKVNDLSWWLIKKLETLIGRRYVPQTYDPNSETEDLALVSKKGSSTSSPSPSPASFPTPLPMTAPSTYEKPYFEYSSD